MTTMKFDINTRENDVAAALAATADTKITVRYDTGNIDTFDRTVTADKDIADTVMNKINAVCDEMSGVFTFPEPSEEAIEAMYQAWLAEKDYAYDALDATLHHYSFAADAATGCY